MKFLSVKVPKNNEYSYEQAFALFSSLITKEKKRILPFLGKPPVTYSFNIISINQKIHFVIGTQPENLTHLKNQILAQYGKGEVLELESFQGVGDINFENVDYGELVLASQNYLPIKTMVDFGEVDPLASVLSAMSRSPDPNSLYWLQIILTPANPKWQKNAMQRISSISASEIVSTKMQTESSMISEKLKYNAFNTNIRVITNSKGSTLELLNAFTVFQNPSGNKLFLKNPNIITRNKLLKSIQLHHPYGTKSLLNTLELSTLWHMPGGDINIPNIAWGKRLQLDPPENLPVATTEMAKEAKDEITFLGKTNYKNREHIFGIKKADRLRHAYIVGKTGTGKSALIVNMAVEDIRKGNGVAVLDPHGDAIADIINYIPKNRINDVCYFNPSDPDYAYPLNILELDNENQRELMVSGIIAIFYKMFSHSWGPRMEHILRNVLFTLAYTDNATLPDVMKILHNKKYRSNVLGKINDQNIRQFWKDEYEAMDQKFATEAISPILNKVGQFVTSPLIRRVIQHPRSKVKITELMDNKKIFLVDLSQGKIGEDNATLLGSMIITQIQIATMNRSFMAEEDRVPFYMYVDEFQNFATSAFTKILSEARKYKLGLTLANQYITQIDEDVMGAVLGNVGTLTCFNVGAQDATLLQKEFGEQIDAEDLTTLDKYQMLTRLAIDNQTSETFTSYSLPKPKNISGHREKIIEQSRKRYGIKS